MSLTNRRSSLKSAWFLSWEKWNNPVCYGQAKLKQNCLCLEPKHDQSQTVNCINNMYSFCKIQGQLEPILGWLKAVSWKHCQNTTWSNLKPLAQAWCVIKVLICPLDNWLPIFCWGNRLVSSASTKFRVQVQYKTLSTSVSTSTKPWVRVRVPDIQTLWVWVLTWFLEAW